MRDYRASGLVLGQITAFCELIKMSVEYSERPLGKSSFEGVKN